MSPSPKIAGAGKNGSLRVQGRAAPPLITIPLAIYPHGYTTSHASLLSQYLLYLRGVHGSDEKDACASRLSSHSPSKPFDAQASTVPAAPVKTDRMGTNGNFRRLLSLSWRDNQRNHLMDRAVNEMI